MTIITPKTLNQWLDTKKDLVILDARARLNAPQAGHQLYQKAHIPSAYFIDMEKDLAAQPSRHGGRHPLPSTGQWTQTLQTLGIDENTSVVIYDDMGARLAAARTWWLLNWAGHKNSFVVDGGWPAWQAAGFAIEQSTPALPATSTWQPEFNDTLICAEHDVESGVGYLLDARASERFRGDFEPIDPKAGHIPGAKNVPGTDLLTSEHNFKPTAELAEILPQDDDVVAYCGSGVSACQLILAYAHIGRALPRLYPGSWSAWCSNDSHDTAQGGA